MLTEANKSESCYIDTLLSINTCNRIFDCPSCHLLVEELYPYGNNTPFRQNSFAKY